MGTQPNTLAQIQAEVKAPKGQFNSFGKYKYRSAEDILESVKPVINPKGFYISISDTIIMVGNRFYVQATVTLSDGKETYTSTALAREEESKKGMDGSQVTGASSSYARKYALSGLFGLDDTKDADAVNTHGNDQKQPAKTELSLVSDDQILDKIQKITTINDLSRYFIDMNQCFDLTPDQKQFFTTRKLQIS
jgi:hypothetical protein